MNPPRSNNYSGYDKINYGFNGVFLNDFNWDLFDLFQQAISRLENISGYNRDSIWEKAIYISGKDLRRYHHIWELFSE